MSDQRQLSAVGGARGAAPGELPASEDVWEADIVTFDDVALADRSRVETLRLALVVDDGTGIIVGSQVQPATDEVEALASIVHVAMTAPLIGDPRRPAAVRIRRSSLTAALAVRLPVGVEVEVADALPCVDAVRDELAAKFEAHDAGDEVECVARPVTQDFFDAAATFYEAAPWQTLGLDTVLEVTVADRPPVYGVALLDEAAGVTGFALYDALESLLPPRGQPTEPVRSAMSVVLYVAESAVPPPAVQERKLRRWRVAGPAAFPTLTRVGADGREREADEAEVRRVAAALRAVAAFAGNVEDGGAADATHTLSATTPEGVTTVVRIRHVADMEHRESADRTLTIESPPTQATDGTPAAELTAAIDLVRRLPHVTGTLRRLAWTFFRARSPRHVASERARLDAVARFGEWAYFSARPGGGKTLAQQGIEVARASLGEPYADALLERTTPRYSIYRVATPGPQHLVVADLLRRETVRLSSVGMLDTLRPGEQFIGNLYPCGDGDWTIRSSVVRIEGRFDDEALEPEAATAASTAECGLFGASHDWLEELDTVADLRFVWHGFRKDLASGGLELPTFAALQRRIRAAESPKSLIPEISTLGWWSVDEAELCVHFFDRAWQLTPRDELGGRSPHAVRKAVRRRGRRRAKKKRAGRA